MTGRRTTVVYAALLTVLAIAITAGIGYGSVWVPPDVVWQVLTHRLTGLGDPNNWTITQDGIVWDLRLPRVLLAAMVGAGHAVVGVAAQALVRNPLADPFLLGISSGACVGAVASIVVGISFWGVTSHALAGVAGALITFLIVYLLAARGGSLSPTRLLLVGVVTGHALLGVANFLVLQADDPGKTNSSLFWLLGSLAGARWTDLGVPAAALSIGLAALLVRGRGLNALLVGDETANALGVPPGRLRRELFATTSLVTGVVVALSGSIYFVGLVVPHAVRLLLGSDHRRVLPAAAIAGAAFLVLVDLAARSVLAPQEVPVGVVTAVIGAPVFLLLMSRRRLSETGL
ncbi:iron complex transport system permease protein [Herbihabitans rhizosphaerae]|uniref:Iron complex transport system permease protein n=1 Tax=Herbihabitans rhizosphaerae TaxID=1872711 RepID=A0A4Q7L616_9PSEU|nr:iron ABC transporter permease [Herbihabitans rhizosphaerae]RZS44734.1 iron complex transport system permease protein [Herbihabitans rhizosphaerae]